MQKKASFFTYLIYFFVWMGIIIVALDFYRHFKVYGVINTEMMDSLIYSLIHSPIDFEFNIDNLKVVVIVTAAYGVFLINLTYSQKKYMLGKEHGSAVWAASRDINLVMDRKNKKNNIILTNSEGVSLDVNVPGLNLNTMIFGGSGTGKTRFFLKPNILQMNTSYVITDPKGEVLRSCETMLLNNGYEVRQLNLIDMALSNHYNPFEYLREGKDEDVMTLIHTIMQNTTENKSSSGDPFWEKAEMLFLQAIFYYLLYEAPKDEQTIPIAMELIRAADIKEDQDEFESDLDILFKNLEEEKGSEHIAVVQYKHFKVAAGKTAKSIIISAAARLAPYNIKAVSELSLDDSLSLSTIGERKTALFVIISPTDTTFNFIAAMMYTQLFAELDHIANWKYGGKLPIKVRFLLDEFANVGKIPNFEKILAYARSLGLGIAPIFQSLSQLKEMYKDGWEGIIDNCSTLLFLGSSSQGTCEYISKMLGKATIDTKTMGKTKGRQPSNSTNFNVLGRELLTPDEVRKMPSNDCILFVKGLSPFYSKKYDIKHHPNYKQLGEQNKLSFWNKLFAALKRKCFKQRIEEKPSIRFLEKTERELIDDELSNSLNVNLEHSIQNLNLPTDIDDLGLEDDELLGDMSIEDEEMLIQKIMDTFYPIKDLALPEGVDLTLEDVL